MLILALVPEDGIKHCIVDLNIVLLEELNTLLDIVLQLNGFADIISKDGTSGWRWTITPSLIMISGKGLTTLEK